MGCHFLLQGIFLTQGSNMGLLHAFTYFCSVTLLLWSIWSNLYDITEHRVGKRWPQPALGCYQPILALHCVHSNLSPTIHLDLSFLIPSCLPPFSFSLPLLSSSLLLSQELDLSSYRSHLELAQTMWTPFLSAWYESCIWATYDKVFWLASEHPGLHLRSDHWGYNGQLSSFHPEYKFL